MPRDVYDGTDDSTRQNHRGNPQGDKYTCGPLHAQMDSVGVLKWVVFVEFSHDFTLPAFWRFVKPFSQPMAGLYSEKHQ